MGRSRITPTRSRRMGAAERPSDRALEDHRLLIAYHRHAERGARDELIERFMPLARQLARRYQRANEPLDDLMQVAAMGLVKAVDRFDPDRGTAFSSYAVPTILGELKRYFRDSGWAVHVPRGMQERVIALNQAIARLSRSGSHPTPADVAQALSISTGEVVEAMEAAVAYDATSLDGSRSTSEGDTPRTHADALGEDDSRYELVEYGATIAPALRDLPPRDRLVLHLRFAEDLTQSEIAAHIGVSQMHVSRLIRASLDRLRTVAEAT